MKTSIDLPDDLFERAMSAVAGRRTTLGKLVIEGLETILREESSAAHPADALARLEAGYHLGGNPLTRGEAQTR
jgi:hypothetical protein